MKTSEDGSPSLDSLLVASLTRVCARQIACVCAQRWPAMSAESLRRRERSHPRGCHLVAWLLAPEVRQRNNVSQRKSHAHGRNVRNHLICEWTRSRLGATAGQWLRCTEQVSISKTTAAFFALYKCSDSDSIASHADVCFDDRSAQTDPVFV